eukprot:9766367-Ditylum_brightwellii.AAC.1
MLMQSPHIDDINNIIIKRKLLDKDIAFAKKVSATCLHDTSAPTSLGVHNNMTQSDKEIWNQSYVKEYFGLHDETKACQYISEEEYKLLKLKVGHIIPTIAIATIKRDENGLPQCAKNCICVLGNLDPNTWSKPDCFAPAMSHLKLRFLVVEVVQFGCTI